MDDGRIVLVKRGGTSQPSRFDPIWADWSMGSAEREAHARRRRRAWRERFGVVRIIA